MVYCDTKQLEQEWFDWLVASGTPSLEPYRKAGVLWTKIDAVDGVVYPCAPERQHCIALPIPVTFNSRGEEVDVVAVAHHTTATEVPFPVDLDDDSLHVPGMPYLQSGVVVPQLLRAGYFLERPESESWSKLASEMEKICNGVACRFNPKSDEEKAHLTNEALVQVLTKVKRRKLLYVPGKAPVFNLVTTTVYRCLYSTMNHDTRQRKCAGKLRDELRSGVLTKPYRSLRVSGSTIRT